MDYVSDDFEPNDFTGSSPYSLSVQAETLICRYLGDLYCINREYSGADSQSGDAIASEFNHLDSLPVLHAVPRGSGSSFCFGEEDEPRFFSPQSLRTRRLSAAL